MDAFLNIIKSTNNIQSNINPTEIYNEGWMTRLLVYYSIQEKIKLPFVDFSTVKNWTSEALISSPFVKASKYREGYTHADMVLGDFNVNYEKRGEVHVDLDPKVFGIIEAKMGSNLSAGTKHAPNYNQASRNVACLAHNAPNENCRTFFSVVAPEKKIKHHDLQSIVTHEFIEKQINERFEMYVSNDDVKTDYEQVMNKVKLCKLFVLSYEDWIELFKEGEVKSFLLEFYNNALKWNRV